MKKEKSKRYSSLEKQAARMTINRQVDYGYRGTTPNYVFDLPKEPVPKN